MFAIDPDTKKVTFDYSNGYDGLTIHYKVKALTAANVPLYVTFSVIGKDQKCRTSTLTWNDASPLQYSLPAYTEEIVTGANMFGIVSNS